MRIGLYNSQGRLIRRISKRHADLMVKQGTAVASRSLYCKRRIFIIDKPEHERRGMRSSTQGATYELAAIDTAPRFFQGGLTRNERQPSKFDLAKAARVGHQ